MVPTMIRSRKETNHLAPTRGGRITHKRKKGTSNAGLSQRRPNEEAKWQSKLQLLRKYRKRNGHCRVPYSYEIDGVKLGNWLSDQRVAYKKHSEGKPARYITQERIDQLEAVGFDFNDTKQKRDEAQWQSKLELLRAVSGAEWTLPSSVQLSNG